MIYHQLESIKAWHIVEKPHKAPFDDLDIDRNWQFFNPLDQVAELQIFGGFDDFNLIFH